MTTSDIVTWIGTFFSIAGAAIAIWQSCEAQSAAQRAIEVRNEITSKHAHGELTELDGTLSAACKAMDKYGPGVSSLSRRGASPSSDAAAVRNFTAALDRHREVLREAFGEPCDDVRDRINRLLVEFGAAPDDTERLAKGRAIYLEVTTFSGNVKSALDGKVFGTKAEAA